MVTIACYLQISSTGLCIKKKKRESMSIWKWESDGTDRKKHPLEAVLWDRNVNIQTHRLLNLNSIEVCVFVCTHIQP